MISFDDLAFWERMLEGRKERPLFRRRGNSKERDPKDAC